ncbi:hypothetical protein B0H11DRAFT_1925690 [Mycena galericulata]|nr:hypothetical protein B0H11DRAFT_1925690 [Mycena galericulata]
MRWVEMQQKWWSITNIKESSKSHAHGHAHAELGRERAEPSWREEPRQLEHAAAGPSRAQRSRELYGNGTGSMPGREEPRDLAPSKRPSGDVGGRAGLAHSFTFHLKPLRAERALECTTRPFCEGAEPDMKMLPGVESATAARTRELKRAGFAFHVGVESASRDARGVAVVSRGGGVNVRGRVCSADEAALDRRGDLRRARAADCQQVRGCSGLGRKPRVGASRVVHAAGRLGSRRRHPQRLGPAIDSGSILRKAGIVGNEGGKQQEGKRAGADSAAIKLPHLGLTFEVETQESPGTWAEAQLASMFLPTTGSDRDAEWDLNGETQYSGGDIIVKRDEKKTRWVEMQRKWYLVFWALRHVNDV